MGEICRSRLSTIPFCTTTGGSKQVLKIVERKTVLYETNALCCSQDDNFEVFYEETKLTAAKSQREETRLLTANLSESEYQTLP
jgi:hypothetical protein